MESNSVNFLFSITYIIGWDAPAVGLKLEISPVISLIIGLIFYCIFVLVLSKILNLLRVSKIVENDAYLVSVRLMPIYPPEVQIGCLQKNIPKPQPQWWVFTSRKSRRSR
jgi:hypothetical protein